MDNHIEPLNSDEIRARIKESDERILLLKKRVSLIDKILLILYVAAIFAIYMCIINFVPTK